MAIRTKFHATAAYLLGGTLMVGLSACNWVDSTGRQGNENPRLDLADGDVIDTPEEHETRIDASAQDADGSVTGYLWSAASAEGALQECVNHLDLDLAGDSLRAVCEDADNCEVLFLESEEDPGVFTVMTPKIKAPVGVTHTLTVSDNDGGESELSVHFCLDSVNEAPSAGNDTYAVSEGDSLVVSAGNSQSLLANDSDDNDVRNQALRIVGVADGKGPQHADNFELGDDGSFTYSISPFTPFSVTQDSFTYRVSDGTHEAEGIVSLDLSVINDPPVVVGFVTDQSATVGVPFGPLDVSENFNDPEGMDLVFSADGLPVGIEITNAGVISGSAAGSNAIGEYSVVVSASDGQHNPSLPAFTLSLLQNQPPTLVSQLADQILTAGTSLTYDASVHFSDPENQPLTFTATGLPQSLSISESGVIAGAPVTPEIGVYNVTVIASDGVAQATMSFTLTVQGNQPPQLTSPIANHSANIGLPVVYDVSGNFSDPENDPITFTAVGLPPSGSLVMSPEGVLSGTPVDADKTTVILATTYTVTVTATDSNGNATTADFKLFIF
ncbi:MAG TPA: hypothetical protein DD979_18020 [Gammaproteobacteria bacterium]|nr:hypothetical protein [Gammaproteobacteria bacterium]